MNTQRATFVIGEDGLVKKVCPPFDASAVRWARFSAKFKSFKQRLFECLLLTAGPGYRQR